ncbi:MAG: YDG domain-containing protein, partial [Ruthenibacterium sp.]
MGKEDVKAAGTAATFADKNVATSKTVTASGIVISGTDAKNYTVNASATAKADITAKALTADMIAAIGDQTYTGKAIEPKLAVTDGTLLVATDYTVTYKDNTNVGTATATVTATANGNYSGTASKTFTINKADSDVTLTGGTFTYGDAITLTATAKIKTRAVGDNKVEFFLGAKPLGIVDVVNGKATLTLA